MIESIRNPSRRLAWGLMEATKEFPQEYESVNVVTADGKQVKGVILNEDSFSVQIMDSGEHIHLLRKDELKSFQKSRESAMPKYDSDVLSDKEVADIVAFLASVGAK
jgi:putative heme-binding domain-containing protein